jgi:hypothetical protein
MYNPLPVIAVVDNNYVVAHLPQLDYSLGNTMCLLDKNTVEN